MKILMKGKVETVSLDRVKPAHLESEPETGTETQRKTQLEGYPRTKLNPVVLSLRILTGRELNRQ